MHDRRTGVVGRPLRIGGTERARAIPGILAHCPPPRTPIPDVARTVIASSAPLDDYVARLPATEDPLSGAIEFLESLPYVALATPDLDLGAQPHVPSL
jgi:hypothetical protein